ncbi:MAG: sulfurtransferase [Methanobacteriota archaeon]|nr:MAG: sulfurtransferase [Euryarchaeota archaeon]HIE63413.1 sulfurtransferase [Candidatus Poseidoniales archaeon]HIL00376.1 sulfurtransferase [Candidatus Poseidoniales archaeon]
MDDTKMQIVNIAGYRFVDLPDRDELRKPFQVKCKELGLKGTILLSPNGINFFLAGTQEMIDEYLQFLEEDERFIGIPTHISYTDYQPFRRMLVRLKNEIISLGMDEVRPIENTGKFIEPMEFKEWLDEGKEVLILDARNDYELRVGTFDNAIDLDIKSFRDFPAAIRGLPKEDKNKPLVMFCTGGIRCEKASVVMENEGWNNVYQIKGGILGYFKETGGAHWNGECFVFDQRVALDKNLKETDTQMCFACREPLDENDLNSENYLIEEFCPYCIEAKKITI